MKFSNRLNESAMVNGKEVWLSRSVAVAVEILYCVDNGQSRELFILVTQRGPGCPNEVGKWCLPCGYLDWDEDGYDAARRETWEETGINLDNLLKSPHRVLCNPASSRAPWRITHNPDDSKLQNITMHFGAAMAGTELPEPKYSLNGGEVDEVSDVRWVNLDDLAKYEFAFSHSKCILEFSKYLIATRGGR